MAKRLKEKVRVVKSKYKPIDNVYEPNIDTRDTDDDFWKVKTVPEMTELVERRKDVDIDARVLGLARGNVAAIANLNKAQFLEASKSNTSSLIQFREAAIRKAFMREQFNDYNISPGQTAANAGLVGDDFVPLLGGPFNKQQYIYDYLQGHSQAFYAYHHDPIARLIVTLIRDFTLGRSFRIDCKGPDAQKAEPYWRAVEKVNDLQTFMDQLSIELTLYGETMVWELPNDWSSIEYHLRPGQESDPAFLPRFKLIDPSVIWDIITYPEDISRVLAYQWVAPTQYQIYTHDKNSNVKVPSLKFIYQQIPASQVDHWKINAVSNEKRGRGDLYSVLGYLKYLRDSVVYKVIAEQKGSAWAIDTTVDGNQDDLDAYYDSQQTLGTIPPAGSEFIHSAKVKREMISNGSISGTQSNAWDWCANMIAAGTGVPVSYWGVVSAHGSSKAGAMVSTEPVVKRFELRRKLLERIMTRMYDRCMTRIGLNSTCEITFPELVVQDRSAKLADLQLAQANDWFSRKRAATMASKEFDVTDFDFDQEEQEIKTEQSTMPPLPGAGPLTAPGQMTPGEMDQQDEQRGTSGTEEESAGGQSVTKSAHPEAFNNSQKRNLRVNRGY